MKHLIRNLAYQLTRKRVAESSLEVHEIRIKHDALSVFSLSTNTILSFEYEGQMCYFRECPCLLSADEFWQTTMNRFFDSLDRLGISRAHFAQEIPVRIAFTETEIRDFRRYLESRGADRDFRNMLRNADQIAKRTGFSIWEHPHWDDAFFEAFSLAGLPENCRDIAGYFLWNMRSAAGSYRLMKLARGARYSFFSAVRSVASQVVAEELGLDHLITPSRWCRLVTDDGNELFGLMSSAAPGGRMADLDIPATPSLQRELTALNVLDVICHQPDHGSNNYSAAVNEAGNMTVCAFDNDNPQTFFPVFSISQPLAGCTPFADRGGNIQRPYMDRTLADRLRCLDQARLRQHLSPYLNRLQITAVLYRLRLVNKAVAHAEKTRPGFLLEVSEWSSHTAAAEISGEYGETYLTRIARPRSEL